MRWITLMVGLLLLPIASDGPDLTVIRLNGMPCGPEGTGPTKKLQELNRLKNRFKTPDKIDETVTLAAMLTPGDDDPSDGTPPFDEGAGGTITGFVIEVIRGGSETGESCNCKATVENECDTHIELALAPNAPATQRVIVEVTPRTRMLANMRGEDWSTKALRTKLLKKWAEFTGWMMFDFEHVKQAENTNPGHAHNFRATCWEIHPVTSIKVLDGPPSPDIQLAPDALAAVQRAHAEAIRVHPSKRDFVAKRNERIASQYKDD
jgi:hypothetical protein